MRMKKKRHGGERISLLSSLFCKDEENLVSDRERIFGNTNPLRIEIGCGKGEFIREKSKQESNYNYLAIEKISDVCVLAAEKYAVSRGLGNPASNGGWRKSDGTVYLYGGQSVNFDGEDLGNVRFVVGDAAKILEKIPADSIDAIFINFCDPWDKKGYEKRRLTYISFLRLYSRILYNNGKIYFKTDNTKLFDFSLAQIEQSSFKTIYYTYDLHCSDINETNIRTEYERNFSEKGLKIKMLIAENNK